ncbi:MAG: anaerobic ribonucleoside-triphosphate reductase [Synergistaceae bacterium]|nr:anaerobic ribonucleoside-triphosphate reductase [Synergistaceae bacterium]
MAKCECRSDHPDEQRRMEVYSRVVGYYRPVAHWNEGKKAEFKNRKNFSLKKAFDMEGNVPDNFKELSTNGE